MPSRAIKKLVINPKAFQKSAAIHRVKASTEDSKVAKQSDDYAEFDQSLQELPEFASVQKQDEPSALVQDPTEDVNIGSEEDPKILKIGTSLSPEEKERLTKFLKQHEEVFAWTYEDMPGLDPKLVEHRLVLKPDVKPVKQKLRKMDPRIEQQVKEGLEDLLKAGFIRTIDYPDWLANIVVVPKKSGKVRICIDFRDLNRATPKDDYPLPSIDLLIDSTAGHAMFSFMDGYSGYNQIKLAARDQSKTSFTTPWGTFCYTVMPFGLKNAGATYQRAMAVIFHDQMRKIMDAYVDDILVKSKEGEDHLEALDQVFKRLILYKLRLNPQKCVFGVESGKLLGFLVSKKGIEVDPAKAKAIINMPPPKNLKELRSLQGRMQSIRRFISNLAMRCEPFNHLLRKGVKFEWGPECQLSFDRIKKYLLNPPILKPPELGKPLLLYISVNQVACGGFLAQYKEGSLIEHAIYYVSKTFIDYEKKYSHIEKTCLALVWMCQKLRHYLLASEVKILSKLNPLKYILEQPFLSGRVAKWQVLLMQYDLEYVSQQSIKGQAIADQLADFPMAEEVKAEDDFPDEQICNIQQSPVWNLFFDGSKNMAGIGIGILLITPEKEMIPFSLKFGFSMHPQYG